MKDWPKIVISLVVGIILALIGAYVQLALSSLNKDLTRYEKCIEQLRNQAREANATIHKRITEECK